MQFLFCWAEKTKQKISAENTDTYLTTKIVWILSKGMSSFTVL